MRRTGADNFDLLLDIAGRGGRGPMLYGESLHLLHRVFEEALLSGANPAVYVEFPLSGKPCVDMQLVYDRVQRGAECRGAGYAAYQPMFDWFSEICGADGLSCGLAIDVSKAEDSIGVYFQHRDRLDFLAPFLESVGENERLSAYLSIAAHMPYGWDAAYIGLFPKRAGMPMRIGGYMAEEARRLGRETAYWAECFEAIGFHAYDEDMLRFCREIACISPAIEYQFDIMPDGTLGEDFGLFCSFRKVRPEEAKQCMETGYGGKLMELLEARGLADSRWRLIGGTAFGKAIPFRLEDGREGQLALCVLLDCAKVKFRGAKPPVAKFYLMLRAVEL